MAVASLCGNAGSKQSVGQVMPRASACRGWVCAPPTPCLQCAHSKTTGATRPPPRLLCAVHLPRTAGVGPVNGARGGRGALSIHPVHLPRTADAGPVDGVTPDQQGLPKDQRPSDFRNTGQGRVGPVRGGTGGGADPTSWPTTARPQLDSI